MAERSGAVAHRHTMDSDPIRDKSTRRDGLRNKHSVATDLEAPVVWLLLGGRQENKENKENKETEGGGGEREGEKDVVRPFLQGRVAKNTITVDESSAAAKRSAGSFTHFY